MSALRRTSLIQGAAGPPGSASGLASWTPGTIVAGDFASTTVAVVGALVGIVAFAAWSTVLPGGVIMWAQCTASGTVTVYMINLSGSNQTISAGTVLAEVLTS